jgi:hypothetical protein
MGELRGKPGELHPARIARELGLRSVGHAAAPLSMIDLLDAAVDEYWRKRAAQSEQRRAAS